MWLQLLMLEAFPWIPTWQQSLVMDLVAHRARHRARVARHLRDTLSKERKRATARALGPCVVVGG